MRRFISTFEVLETITELGHEEYDTKELTLEQQIYLLHIIKITNRFSFIAFIILFFASFYILITLATFLDLVQSDYFSYFGIFAFIILALMSSAITGFTKKLYIESIIKDFKIDNNKRIDKGGEKNDKG